MKQAKTNAMRLLESKGINYEPQYYDISGGAIDRLSGAAKTGRDPATVFKTLVPQGAYFFK